MDTDQTLEKALPDRHPPGPTGGLFFGCLGELRRDPMRFSTRVAQTHGGIARIPLGRRHVYLVSEPTLLHELLIVRRASYMKNVRYSQIQDVIGLGLLLAEGEVWKRQRLITQPAFKPAHVHAQVPWMAEVTERFLDGWMSRTDTGRAFDVEPLFLGLGRELSGAMILGPQFREIADRFCELTAVLKNAWPRSPRSVVGGFRPPPVIKFLRFKKALTKLDALIYGFLDERRRNGFADCGIVTTLARSSTEQGEPFSNAELRDQILTLFFAGHETSATSLTWTHFLLSRHPEVRDRLRREAQRVLGGNRPTASEVKKLTYTEQVLNESLRLYSPIHAISRVAIEDNFIGGYLIPKGSTVVVSLFATHRLPEYWPDPERFDPDRFTADQVAERANFSFLPFAAGHRNCIGGSMAMIELKLVMAQLARRYRLELVPDHPVEPEPATTMRPRYGMKMTLHKADRSL